MGITVQVLGGLGLFLFGMKIMSEALQIAAGENMRRILTKVTNNRVKGVFTGFTITSIIQSSSATTVMLVSFVSAGLITLQQSIGIILGANIGTTITAWLVALLGFKVKIKAFALPAIAIGFFIRFVNNRRIKDIGEIMLGFGILFLGLDIMSGAVDGLKGSENILEKMSMFRAEGIGGTLLVILTGSVITMIIQSSSATMAMTMTLAVPGLIDFNTACALVLGENIGTTITANISAIGASRSAKRAALVHFIFNMFGVLWVAIILKQIFIPLVDSIFPGDPYSTGKAGEAVIGDHLAGFHSLFNIMNTLIFLPFVNQLAKLAEKLIPGEGKDEILHLQYISNNLVSTPSININQARLETKRMSELCLSMFNLLTEVITNPQKKMGKTVERILKKESAVDMLEKEISEFLVKTSQNNISEAQSQQISSLLHAVNELERIGDHCERLLKLNRRRYDKKIIFSESATNSIKEISDKVLKIIQLISNNIDKETENILPEAEVLENRIDELRRELRKDHIRRLNSQKCSVDAGLIFIDMLTSYEKMGDHAFNIAESISGERYF